MRRALFLATSTLLVLAASPAEASEASRLFTEGVKLLDQGRVAEACPKLEESQRLEPAAGTLLNLAACYEKSGRKLQALETFRAASQAAHARGRADWQRVADEHAASLSASLPTLSINLTDPRADLEVRVDDKIIREPSVTVEPGPHTVVASSAGKKPFSVKVDVSKSTVVVVPALEAAGGTAPPPPPPRPKTELGMRRTVGLALGAAGVGGLVFAGVSAFVAAGALDDAKTQCPEYPAHCTSAAQEPNDKAETWSTIATIAGIAGVTLAAGGAVLFFLPTSNSASVGVRAAF